MNIAATIIKCKSAPKLDKEIEENRNYMKAAKKFQKIINEELSEEDVLELNELLGIYMVVLKNAYLDEGMKLGEKLATALLLE